MNNGIGLIVGSGLSKLSLTIAARRSVDTPFGAPSSPLLTAELGGRSVVCIARHGEEHTIAPHEVNYRANLWALQQDGVRCCIGLNIVGAIAAGFEPGQLAIPDQLIDYSWGRPGTYGGGGRELAHIDFTEPFDPILRGRIAAAADACGFPISAGVYAVTQGPRLETAAEIDRLARDGCTMVGMTAMPEAALARELKIDYAVCALAVNHAAGRSPTGLPIHGQIEQILSEGMERVDKLLNLLIPALCDQTM